MAAITPIVMPKWGLSMTEGTVTSWLVEVGTTITVGMPIMEVETDKIANEVEAPDPGLLRRKIAAEGDVLPIQALVGVMAGPEVSEEDIDAFVASWVTPSAEDAGEEAGPAYSFLEVDGIRIRYARRGPAEGIPVVLIHGFGGDLDNWLFNIDVIAARAPVIALDLPGHGESTLKLPGKGLASLATFVSRFLELAGVAEAHLVGHSMGGAIAAQMALDGTTRVVSLTLIGSAGFGPDINAAYIEGFAHAQSRRELQPVLQMLFADASLVSRKLVDDVLKYKRLDGVDAVLGSLEESLFPQGRQLDLPGLALVKTALGARTIVIWGREDQVISVTHSLAAPNPAGTTIFAGAGHMAQMERANEVNRLILSHIGS